MSEQEDEDNSLALSVRSVSTDASSPRAIPRPRSSAHGASPAAFLVSIDDSDVLGGGVGHEDEEENLPAGDGDEDEDDEDEEEREQYERDLLSLLSAQPSDAMLPGGQSLPPPVLSAYLVLLRDLLISRSRLDEAGAARFDEGWAIKQPLALLWGKQQQQQQAPSSFWSRGSSSAVAPAPAPAASLSSLAASQAARQAAEAAASAVVDDDEEDSGASRSSASSLARSVVRGAVKAAVVRAAQAQAQEESEEEAACRLVLEEAVAECFLALAIYGAAEQAEQLHRARVSLDSLLPHWRRQVNALVPTFAVSAPAVEDEDVEED